MIKLLTIVTPLFFTLCLKGQSPCDITVTKSVPVFFYAADTSHYYDYYNANGIRAWIHHPGYEENSIPSGGWVVKLENVNPHFDIIKGFADIQNIECRMYYFNRVDLKKKPLDRKWMVLQINPR